MPRQKIAPVFLTVFLVGVAAGCWQQSTSITTPTSKTYEREELRKLVQGKTEAEVLKLLGPPHQRSGDELEWTYKRVAYDRLNGKTDFLAVIHFQNGRAVSVTY